MRRSIALHDAAIAPLDLLLLLVLGAIWGASFLFIRVAAPALGPLPMVELRCLISGVLLFAYAASRNGVPERARWRQFLVLGTLNNVIPFATIATAELVLTAGLGAILNATSPFFTVIVAAVWERRRPSAVQVLGTVIGFVGVTALVGLGPVEVTPAVVGASGLALIGGFGYALAAVYVSRTFRGVPAAQISAGQLLAASAVLAVPAVATRTAAPPDPAVIASVLALSLLGTVLGYLIYFGLIARVGPTRAITVTLLVPVFGVLFGWAVLGEPLGAGLLTGLALVLAGVALTTGVVRLGQSSQKGAT